MGLLTKKNQVIYFSLLIRTYRTDDYDSSRDEVFIVCHLKSFRASSSDDLRETERDQCDVD